MLIKPNRFGYDQPVSSEITPSGIYAGRRDLMKFMASGVAGAALASWASREANAQAGGATPRPGKLAALPSARSSVPGAMSVEKLTDYKLASTYNNYYEFGTDKADPAQNAHTLKTSPWTVEVEGLVKKPAKYTLEDLLKLSAQEERIYRLRCVEGWSMVIPWVGYSLSELIKKVEPLGSAKYVEFITLADKKTMPGLGSRVLDWPYVEGLRMDEAMNPLTLLSAHFSDRGRPFRRDRGRRFRAIVDAQGMRASEELNVSQGPTRCPACHREAWHQWSFNCSGSLRVPPFRAMRWLR